MGNILHIRRALTSKTSQRNVPREMENGFQFCSRAVLRDFHFFPREYCYRESPPYYSEMYLTYLAYGDA